jgi:hypothetical protein
MWIKLAAMFSLGLIFLSCTRSLSDRTPEGALDSYVKTAFSVKKSADREKLLELSIGEAREQLQGMSEEDFMARFGNGSIRLIDLKMKDKRSEKDGGVSLVYELSYEDGNGGKGPVTHKKIAYLQQQDGGWRIRGTKNIKEYVEQNAPMVIELTK